MIKSERVGEVVEASTTSFMAQCYDLFQLPPLGCLVKIMNTQVILYGIVYQAITSSLEPGRRPIARGKNEDSEEAIYHSHPQILKLLRSEFSVLIVGYQEAEKVHHFLPPSPARIHAFVYYCSQKEVKEFSQSFGFLNILLNTPLSISPEELTAASLRQMSKVYPDRHSFLVMAGKELAVLLGGQFNQLKAILERIKE